MAIKPMSFTGVVLKNLFSKPVTKRYPQEPAVFQTRTRGHIEIDINACIMCGNCQRNCPPLAITVDRLKGTWSILRFDCVQCGYCTDVCPKHCLSLVPGYPTPGGVKEAEVVAKPDYVAPNVTNVRTVGKAAPRTPPKPQADLSQCVFCTLCAKKCPQNAITVDRQAKTWTLSAPDDCISCALCAAGCPKKCIKMVSGTAKAE